VSSLCSLLWKREYLVDNCVLVTSLPGLPLGTGGGYCS